MEINPRLCGGKRGHPATPLNGRMCRSHKHISQIERLHDRRSLSVRLKTKAKSSLGSSVTNSTLSPLQGPRGARRMDYPMLTSQSPRSGQQCAPVGPVCAPLAPEKTRRRGPTYTRRTRICLPPSPPSAASPARFCPGRYAERFRPIWDAYEFFR